MKDDRNTHPTFRELLASGEPTCPVPTAGWILYKVGPSRSYQLAHAGMIPTLRLGERRMVVPVARLAEMLGYAAPVP
jgi:hypothetical protein